MLGIRTTRRISMQVLSSKLAGFLEYVPRAHFKHLQRLHYKSLYSFDFQDPEDAALGNRIITKTYHFILFGPLALCNANDEIAVSFFNFDDRDGSLLIWKSSLLMAAEDNENDIESFTAFDSTDRLKISDGALASNGEGYNTYGIESMSALKHVYKNVGPDTNQEKVEFFVKVILHHRSKVMFTNHYYEPDEEVFVRYNLTDRLIV